MDSSRSELAYSGRCSARCFAMDRLIGPYTSGLTYEMDAVLQDLNTPVQPSGVKGEAVGVLGLLAASG